jgi:hypothetical protein
MIYDIEVSLLSEIAAGPTSVEEDLLKLAEFSDVAANILWVVVVHEIGNPNLISSLTQFLD